MEKEYTQKLLREYEKGERELIKEKLDRAFKLKLLNKGVVSFQEVTK